MHRKLPDGKGEKPLWCLWSPLSMSGAVGGEGGDTKSAVVTGLSVFCHQPCGEDCLTCSGCSTRLIRLWPGGRGGCWVGPQTAHPAAGFCHWPLGRERPPPHPVRPEICRIFSQKSKQPVQPGHDLFQLSDGVTHLLPRFHSPSLGFLPRLSLLLSNLYYVSPVAFNLSGRYLPGTLVCECKIDVLLKKDDYK